MDGPGGGGVSACLGKREAIMAIEAAVLPLMPKALAAREDPLARIFRLMSIARSVHTLK